MDKGRREHRLLLPVGKACRLEELFDGGEVLLANGTGQLPHAPGATKLYLLADSVLGIRAGHRATDGSATIIHSKT